MGNSNTVLHTADAGATWIPQTANFGSYNDVQFISGTQGWAVGRGSLATVITTTDAGNTWTNLPQPLTSLITAVNFVSPTKGWWNEASSTTSFGSIRTTTDGGVSWTSQPTPVAVATQDAFFIDAGLGWTVGNSGIILKFT